MLSVLHDLVFTTTDLTEEIGFRGIPFGVGHRINCLKDSSL